MEDDGYYEEEDEEDDLDEQPGGDDFLAVVYGFNRFAGRDSCTCSSSQICKASAGIHIMLT